MHRLRRSARLLVTVLLLLVGAGFAASCSIPKKPASPQPLRVEVWGDSFAAQAEPYIDFYLDLSRKAKVEVHAYGATALCDWFSDMYSETNPANPAGFHHRSPSSSSRVTRSRNACRPGAVSPTPGRPS